MLFHLPRIYFSSLHLPISDHFITWQLSFMTPARDPPLTFLSWLFMSLYFKLYVFFYQSYWVTSNKNKKPIIITSTLTVLITYLEHLYDSIRYLSVDWKMKLKVTNFIAIHSYHFPTLSVGLLVVILLFVWVQIRVLFFFFFNTLLIRRFAVNISYGVAY